MPACARVEAFAGAFVKLCERDFPHGLCIGTVYAHVLILVSGNASIGFTYCAHFVLLFLVCESIRVYLAL